MPNIEYFKNRICSGDCKIILTKIPDNSIDAIVTDPPYELSFMNKGWDGTGIAYDIEMWKECLRVLKPGGHLLSFGGTRTYHRMVCAIEDAGFEIRDNIVELLSTDTAVVNFLESLSQAQVEAFLRVIEESQFGGTIEYIYGSGFPKSQNIEKVLIKKLGECEVGDAERSDSQEIPKYELRLVRATNLPQEKSDRTASNEVLQSCMSEQGLQGTELWEEPQKSIEDGKESSVEGWRYIQATEGELRKCEVCEMSSRIFTDGKERRLCHGTPFGYGTASWQNTFENRSCSSYRSRLDKQSNNKPDDVQEQRGTQEIRRAIETYKGFGSALKPAHEPIVLARKPLSEKTIVANVLKWGTGGIAIDDCRIEHNEDVKTTNRQKDKGDIWNKDSCGLRSNPTNIASANPQGRFPANIIHDGSEELVQGFPQTKSGKLQPHHGTGTSGLGIVQPRKEYTGERGGDSGSASRFFYCAKASKSERNIGLLNKDEVTVDDGRQKTIDNPFQRGKTLRKNNHPTVKPIKLIEYLVKLISKEDDIVLDPFFGSGTTGIACVNLNRNFVGIEKEEEYAEIAKARIDYLKNDKEE